MSSSGSSTPSPSSQHSLPRIEAELCRRSLLRFVRAAWPVVEPTTPFVSGWCLEAICEHLEAAWRRQIRKLLINVPPGHCKSTLVSIMLPAWGWAQDPSVRWLYASYAADLALRDAARSRRLLESEWFRQCWPGVVLAGDQNAKGYYETTATGSRRSTGLSGSTGQRAGFLVVDDPHDLQEAYSKPAREAVVEWWSGVMSQRVDDPATAVRICIMQRCHQDDLSGYLLREEGDWEHLCLPAEYEAGHPHLARTTLHGGWTDPRTREGELLWPERFPPAVLAEQKRDLGSRKASGQLQQRPAADKGSILDARHWLKRFAVAPAHFDELLQSWDLAFKGHDDSDFVCGGLWGRVGADAYLLDVARGQWSFPVTVQAIRDRARDPMWGRARAKLVEDKANGPAVLATLQREIPGLIAVDPQGGKEARAHAVAPFMEAGNVWIPASAPWAAKYIDELTDFPTGANDDQVDMTTQALIRLLCRPVGTTRSVVVEHPPEAFRHARPGWGR